MKRIIILFFTIIVVLPAYCQSYLQDGDRCFDSGDYTCAISNYNEAFKLARENKQIIDIKLTKAKHCAEWANAANQAFNNRSYGVAKENYQKILDANLKDEYAKAQLDKCNNALNPPATTLSISKESLSFSASGGNESITVTSNASSYSVSALPAWCTVQKYAGYFVITCAANSLGATRTDYFTVTAGDKTKRINISQTGKTTSNTAKQEITLSVSQDNLSFYSSGGNSEQIKVYSNASTYSISLVPLWCSVQTYNGYFVVSCSANNGQSRSDWFKVTAGGKEAKIYVKQEGVTSMISQKSNTSTISNTKSTYNKAKCFNCPKTKDTWGLTLGYVQKKLDFDFGYYDYDYNYCDYFNGVQFGLRVEPLFKYGFGLNTGILLEAYFPNDTESTWNNDELEFYALNIPLHLEYRLNFSKWFNMFAYGGVGFNVVANSSFDDYTFPATFEYGGGFRINHVQFNIGQSLYLGDFKNMEYFRNDIRTYQKLVISASYMF